jgi:hypothetical protein
MDGIIDATCDGFSDGRVVGSTEWIIDGFVVGA